MGHRGRRGPEREFPKGGASGKLVADFPIPIGAEGSYPELAATSMVLAHLAGRYHPGVHGGRGDPGLSGGVYAVSGDHAPCPPVRLRSLARAVEERNSRIGELKILLGDWDPERTAFLECQSVPDELDAGRVLLRLLIDHAARTFGAASPPVSWSSVSSAAAQTVCRGPARRMPRAAPRPFISTVNLAASPFIWFADKEESL